MGLYHSYVTCDNYPQYIYLIKNMELMLNADYGLFIVCQGFFGFFVLYFEIQVLA